MKYVLIVSVNKKEWGTKESKGSYHKGASIVKLNWLVKRHVLG